MEWIWEEVLFFFIVFWKFFGFRCFRFVIFLRLFFRFKEEEFKILLIIFFLGLFFNGNNVYSKGIEEIVRVGYIDKENIYLKLEYFYEREVYFYFY